MTNGLDRGIIQECGIDRSHVNTANEIYVKTVQRANAMNRDSSYVGFSPSILEYYKEVPLGVNILFINKVPYLFAISRHIKFIQCLCIWNQSDNIYVDSIRKIKSVYEMRGFNVNKIYADRFESCRVELAELGLELICCDKNAQVHFAERGISFIKKTIRCIWSMLPIGIKESPRD